MGLKAGIVGLPNVGKSTLFNAITKAQVEAANYPFATIQPNTGVVKVEDERLLFLSDLFKPKKTIHATVDFVDIAGLVKGASKGEGLGNQFLAAIREADAIVEVVRCFDNPDIIHVESSVDPARDIAIIELELIMADLQSLQRRLDKVSSKAKGGDRSAAQEVELINRVRAQLELEVPARKQGLSSEEQAILAPYQLLTLKPLLYVANIHEDDYVHLQDQPYYQAVKKIADEEGAKVIAIACEIESQIAQLEGKEQLDFLGSLGIAEPGLNKLVRSTYQLLRLSTYFTVGEDECKAWTFIAGMKAPQCAGIIHTDFEKGFIKAEVYHVNDIVELKSEAAIKEAGKLRIEGKEYEVKDGDIIFFRFH